VSSDSVTRPEAANLPSGPVEDAAAAELEDVDGPASFWIRSKRPASAAEFTLNVPNRTTSPADITAGVNFLRIALLSSPNDVLGC
jgi:hypothetical protein